MHLREGYIIYWQICPTSFLRGRSWLNVFPPLTNKIRSEKCRWLVLHVAPPLFFLESYFCGQEAVPSSGCDGEMEMIVRWPIGSVCGFAHGLASLGPSSDWSIR